ncbi:aspartokinase [Cordyceps javanica]|nr:aspartokinase [Cordyceps javanica]
MLASEVGRGYTDLCAALCAVGLGAAELQIWKEVDGILTADPSRVPGARLIPHMSLREAASLTRNGSEVVHALAIRQIAAAPTAIALCIRNVKRPSGPGTMVARAADGKGESSNDSDTDCASLDKCGPAFCRAITVKNDACLLHVRRGGETSSCFPKRAAASSSSPREVAMVEFLTPNAARLPSSQPYPKRPRRLSLSYAKSLLLGRAKFTSAQSASIITLICSRADDGNHRLASHALTVLRTGNIVSTLLPRQMTLGASHASCRHWRHCAP